VLDAANPKTIHDFRGFPEELYQVRYTCPGAPELVEEVRSLISAVRVELDSEWGLDHGTCPQLSIDIARPARFHYELGAELAPLRDQGVLIMGSGNIVHNLGRAVSLSIPAPDHYWPLMYILGLKRNDERGVIESATFPVTGIAHGSVSMRAVLIGEA